MCKLTTTSKTDKDSFVSLYLRLPPTFETVGQIESHAAALLIAYHIFPGGCCRVWRGSIMSGRDADAALPVVKVKWQCVGLVSEIAE